MIKRALTILSFVLSFVAKGQQDPAIKPDLWAISKEYLKAFEEINFDKMGTFLHDSVRFFDIGSTAEGKINVINSWKKTFATKPERIHFEVREHFVSGSFVVIDLRYEVANKVEDQNILLNIEVITVLQFRGDKIILLHDYPDFTSYGRQLSSQLKNTKPIQNASRQANIKETLAYYQAYSRWDVDAMSTFFHDSIDFKDLTAKDLFKEGKYEHVGKEAVTNFWSGIFGDTKLSFVDMTVHNTFTAGDYVIANTTLSLVLPASWTGNAPGKVYVSLPIKTLLKFKDKKIISQYDFADYTLFNEQIQVQLAKP